MVLFALGYNVAMIVAVKFVQHGAVVAGEALSLRDDSLEQGWRVKCLLHTEQGRLDEVEGTFRNLGPFRGCDFKFDKIQTVVAMEDYIQGDCFTAPVDGYLDRISLFPLPGTQDVEDFLCRFKTDNVVESLPDEFDRIPPEDRFCIAADLADHLSTRTQSKQNAEGLDKARNMDWFARAI